MSVQLAKPIDAMLCLCARMNAQMLKLLLPIDGRIMARLDLDSCCSPNNAPSQYRLVFLLDITGALEISHEIVGRQADTARGRLFGEQRSCRDSSRAMIRPSMGKSVSTLRVQFSRTGKSIASIGLGELTLIPIGLGWSQN